MDRTTLNLHLEFEGLSPETMGWTMFREFMDRFTEALAAMPGGPSPSEVMPLSIKGGSLSEVISVPRSALPSVRHLQRGPSRHWSTATRTGAESFYQWMRSHQARLSCGRRALRPVIIPDDSRKWTVVENVSDEGVVQRAGGEEAKVAIRFATGIVHCEAGESLAIDMARHLYRRVLVDGERHQDVNNGAVLKFIVRSFRPIERRGLVEMHRELMAFLGHDTDGLDVEASIREMRG